jgi:hypothetical protein
MILAIIDHLNHQLFIENADNNEIETEYKGEAEAYIRDKYGFKDEDLFSWEYLTEQIEVFGAKNSNVMVHFN